ncbi:MAG: DUF5723 family protein [Bacteroidales bacterium]
MNRSRFIGILQIGLLVLAGSSATLQAQNKSLFFSGLHPQTIRMNPAFHPEGSRLIFSPSFFGYFENSSLTVNDMLTTKEVNGVSDVYWDFETIDRQLRDRNYVRFGAGATPLYLGLRAGPAWYLNLAVSLTNTSYFQFPGTISQIRYGNADLENDRPRTIDLNGYGLHELSYASYRLGAVFEPSPAWKIGVHVNVLMGLSAIETQHFEASIETSEDFTTSLLETDIAMNVSGTLFESDKLTRVFRPVLAFDEFVLGKNAASFQNTGLGMDLGIVWDPGRTWSWYASVLDLGSIHWRLDPQRLVSKGEYQFEGIQFSPYTLVEEDFSFSEYLKQYADTVLATVIPDAVSEDFRTSLYPKAYLGTSYRLSDALHFHVLFHATKYKEDVLTEATISATWRPWVPLSLTGSLSYSNFWLYNLGLALRLETDRIQYFLASDAVNAFLDKRNSRGVNFAFGMNLALWAKAPGKPLVD